MYNIVNKWENDRFSLLLEDVQGYLFAHCYVYDESLSTIKELKSLVKEVVDWAYSDGYDGVHAITDNMKFAEKTMGAKFLEELNQDGRTYGVYKWGWDLR